MSVAHSELNTSPDYCGVSYRYRGSLIEQGTADSRTELTACRGDRITSGSVVICTVLPKMLDKINKNIPIYA